MGSWRGALAAVLLLGPLLAAPAAATASYSFDVRDVTNQTRGNQMTGVPGEFHLGETVRFRIIITSDSSFSVTKVFRLYREGTYVGIVGSGASIPVTPNIPTTIVQDWSPGLSSSQRGHWRAEFDVPGQTLVALFDVDHAPNFQITYLQIDHDNFLINFGFLHDGTSKMVQGCVKNYGLDTTPQSARVGLFFRTPVDPLVIVGEPDGLPTWLDGHPIAEKTVLFGFPNFTCNQKGLPGDGWWVQFEWDTLESLDEGSFAMSRLGLRADPQNTVWEEREDDNENEDESTVQPVDALP